MHGSHGKHGFGDRYSWRCVHIEAFEETLSPPEDTEQDEDVFLGVEALIRSSVFGVRNDLAMGLRGV
jgi:hypothetical protein